jgi:hypothetical protein
MKAVTAIVAAALLATPAAATPVRLSDALLDEVMAGAMSAAQAAQMLRNVIASASTEERRKWNVMITATGSNASATLLTIYTQGAKGSPAMRAYVEPRVRKQFGSQLGAGWRLQIGK